MSLKVKKLVPAPPKAAVKVNALKAKKVVLGDVHSHQRRSTAMNIISFNLSMAL